LWAASQGTKIGSDDHHNHGEHGDHQTVSVLNDGSAPSLSVILHPDAVAGWNLELQTKNFSFSPETVNQANVPNSGHAHVYVDGIKLARVYGPWFHIPAQPTGLHTIAVELNANDHSPFAVAGNPVRVELKVTVP
jgi:hypothetical protein